MKDFWRGNHAEQAEIFARKESLASTINRLMMRWFSRGQSMLPLIICMRLWAESWFFMAVGILLSAYYWHPRGSIEFLFTYIRLVTSH